MTDEEKQAYLTRGQEIDAKMREEEEKERIERRSIRDALCQIAIDAGVEWVDKSDRDLAWALQNQIENKCIVPRAEWNEWKKSHELFPKLREDADRYLAERNRFKADLDVANREFARVHENQKGWERRTKELYNLATRLREKHGRDLIDDMGSDVPERLMKLVEEKWVPGYRELGRVKRVLDEERKTMAELEERLESLGYNPEGSDIAEWVERAFAEVARAAHYDAEKLIELQSRVRDLVELQGQIDGCQDAIIDALKQEPLPSSEERARFSNQGRRGPDPAIYPDEAVQEAFAALDEVESHRKRLEGLQAEAREKITKGVKGFAERLNQKPPNPKETIEKVQVPTKADFDRDALDMAAAVLANPPGQIAEALATAIAPAAKGTQIPCASLSKDGTVKCVLPKSHVGLHRGDVDPKSGTIPFWKSKMREPGHPTRERHVWGGEDDGW